MTLYAQSTPQFKYASLLNGKMFKINLQKNKNFREKNHTTKRPNSESASLCKQKRPLQHFPNSLDNRDTTN